MSIGTLSIGPTPGAYAPENFKSGNTSLGTSRPVISTPDTCIQESSASIVSLQGHSETEPSLRKARNDNMLVDPYWFEEPTGLNEKPLLATVYEGYQPVDKTTPTNGFYITNKEAVGRFISEQFRRMFLQYALIIKKQEDIKGSLFVKPFRRLMIEQQNYLEQVIFYIHTNPAKHEVQRDYKSYRYSSYRHILSSKSTFLARNHVLDIFGGVKGFDEYHDWRWEEREAILAASKTNEELQE